ncbi:MAG: class I SAM-dependent DNA methyltransferase [Cyclobacteriaceae bacterium]
MKNLEQLLLEIGLDRSNGLFYSKEDRWKTDTTFPNRVRRLIERKIGPDAFFCFDNKPLVLFFENPPNKEKLHKAIWNFNECPIAIIIDNGTVEIFNGFSYLKDKSTLDKIGGSERLSDFTYFELVTGKTWEQYKDQLDYKNRVDYHLLENIKSARKLLVEKHRLDAKIVNSIIGKSIFVRYLIDRGVKMKFDGTLRKWTNAEFCGLLDSPKKIEQFFDYLEDAERGFNGDLFPLTASEYRQVKKEDYQVIKQLLEGVDLDQKQLSFFELYDFSIIPIEFISNIYELFIGQDNQKKEGAYYTPLFLVDYILKETVERKVGNENQNFNCKVLDPACGSGIFLVESLRKIIEKFIRETNCDVRLPNFKTSIKKLAKDNIYGVDKDLSAVQVAIFSIYLTLLDYLEPPGIETFKFPVLLNSNFFHADFFDESVQFNIELKNIEFDFILGNPPWNRGKGETIKPTYVEYIEQRRKKERGSKDNIEIGNREIAQAFLLRSSDFSSAQTKCALIVTSKTLYNLQSHGFRKYFLENYFIERVFELAPVRREVFDKSNDKATTPACILFFNHSQGMSTDENFIEHIALKPSRFFSLFKIFTVSKTDYKSVQQKKLKEFDWLWKVLVYGSYLDFNFLARLKNEYETISKFLSRKKALVKQGIKRVDGNKKIDVSELIGWDFLELKKKEISQFAISTKHEKWKIKSVGYIYREHNRICKSVFSPPVLLVKETVNTKLESVSAISSKKILFTDKITSIKLRESQDSDDYYLLAALMNSTLFAYYVLNISSTAGIMIEQQINDEERFGFPIIKSKLLVGLAKELERSKSDNFKNFLISDQELLKQQSKKRELDTHILKQFELDIHEETLVAYAKDVMIPIAMRHKDFERLFQPSSFYDPILESYALLYIERFKSKLDNEKKKFIVEIWHTNQIVGMFFKMIPISEYSLGIVWDNKQAKDNEILSVLTQISSEKITDKLFVQKDVRGFEKDYFYIFKPNEKRLWHKAIGYMDVNEFADAILKKGSKAK